MANRDIHKDEKKKKKKTINEKPVTASQARPSTIQPEIITKQKKDIEKP